MLRKLLFIIICTAYNITYSCDDFDTFFNNAFHQYNLTSTEQTEQYATTIINEEQSQTNHFALVDNENTIIIDASKDNNLLHKKRKRHKENSNKQNIKEVEKYINVVIDDLNLDFNSIELDEYIQNIKDELLSISPQIHQVNSNKNHIYKLIYKQVIRENG